MKRNKKAQAQRALVLFSGGQDSTTCLGWTKNRYRDVHAIAFSYGQRHSIEIQQARRIAATLDVPIKVVDISFLKDIVVSALTGTGDVSKRHRDNKNLPASFVPDRNALFITLAHAYAQTIKADVLVGGMCQTDYSGYPDCRRPFITSLIKTLNAGSDVHIAMLTPIMHLTKAETFALAAEEGVLDLVLNESHTCYEGDRKKYPWGKGCGTCPACTLRKRGYEQFLKIK
ncbi:MAG: 7-cyano-7-deazaguanine synthase QueC [Spirochaetes bacterium]|nr:7-cyano-7-deazaguanine synthase QueC [Spirochaetota bacterium]